MIYSDSHNDFLTQLSLKEREEYLEKCRMSGVKTMSSAIFTTNKVYTLRDLRVFKNEIKRLSQKYKINLLFSIEDIAFLEVEELENFCNLRPFSVTLTWNEKNKFAGGAKTKFGLSSLGKIAVEMLENCGILIDTAHMSKQTFEDFIKISKRPIFNSHSNIYSLHKNERNLTDDQIKIIVDTNGFWGITLYDEFIKGEKVSVKDVALQFDYLIKKFGHKNFGFGTDFYGIDENRLPEGIRSYEDLNKVLDELKKLGHSDEIIECLAYKNFADFLTRLKIFQSKD